MPDSRNGRSILLGAAALAAVVVGVIVIGWREGEQATEAEVQQETDSRGVVGSTSVPGEVKAPAPTVAVDGDEGRPGLGPAPAIVGLVIM